MKANNLLLTFKRLVSIAHNTFREAVRDKVFYNLFFFALVLIVFSYFLAELSIGENEKIVKDVGLAAISLFGVLISIFVGIGQLNKEVERRTIYTIISKPISRWQFLLGKYIGLAFTIFVEVAVMTVCLMLVLYYGKRTLDFSILPAILLIYVELLVITAAALMFVSYSSPFVATLFSISFFAVGHTTTDLVRIALKSKKPLFIAFAKTLNGFLNLDLFNIKGIVVHGLPLSRSMLVDSVWYGVVLCTFLMTVACIIFQRKDFK